MITYGNSEVLEISKSFLRSLPKTKAVNGNSERNRKNKERGNNRKGKKLIDGRYQ